MDAAAATGTCLTHPCRLGSRRRQGGLFRAAAWIIDLLLIKRQYLRAAVSGLAAREHEEPRTVSVAGVCDRPQNVILVVFWCHFAVLTINTRVSHIRDHLFLVREGCNKWKSWNSRSCILEPLFETGSMPGLIRTFRRHSGLYTNFKIYKMESRPIEVPRAVC